MRMALLLTSFIRASIPENEVPTFWMDELRRDRNMIGAHTWNSRLSPVIFFEYSRSETRTLFSSCSVLAWTSFLTAMSLSTAASNVRINGLGSNAAIG